MGSEQSLHRDTISSINFWQTGNYQDFLIKISSAVMENPLTVCG